MAKIKPKSKTAKTTKPAKAEAAPKSAPKSKKVDRGESAYAVQAKKMKALLDTLKESPAGLEESKVIKELTRRGFPLHPRTLLREVDRVRILGYGVERVVSEAGVVYTLAIDPKVAEAFATLEAARKELRKAGSPLEKTIAAALKVLKA